MKRGEPLLWVHAASDEAADAALDRLAQLLCVLDPQQARPAEHGPVVCAVIDA